MSVRAAIARSMDVVSREWLCSLRADEATREEALARLHALRLRAARFEAARRRELPRQLQVAGADLGGVFTLRSLDDATAIRDAAATTRDALVVGGAHQGNVVTAADQSLFGRSRTCGETRFSG
jgi:hypothetical protein